MALINDTTFVVVDTETTGLKASRGRLLELAAVKVRGGKEIGHFAQLVNPGCTISRRISRINGITTGMVFDKPAVEDVLPDFVDFLEDAVFVAHNRAFDEGFINGELKRADLPLLTSDMLCTVRMARRLLPELRSRSLGSLIKHYGLRIDARHRALADARATAAILQHLLERLEERHNITLRDDLLRFQYRPYRSRGSYASQRHPHGGNGRDASARRPHGALGERALPHWRDLHEKINQKAPKTPGVYYFKDGKGALLYVGKAQSLKERLRTYFVGIGGRPPRLRKLVEQAREVEWRETSSELHALLLESKEIKHRRPRFNRADRRYRNLPFLRLAPAESPPLSWTIALRCEEGAEYFGPVTSRRTAERAVGFLNGYIFQIPPSEPPGCARGANEMGPAVHDLLCGRNADVMLGVEEAMLAAAEELDFERAGRLRDGLRAVHAVYGRQRSLGAPIGQHHGVVLQPAVAGAARAFVIAGGRLRDTVLLRRDAFEADVQALYVTIQKHQHSLSEAGRRYSREETDEMRLLMHWLYVRRDELRIISRRREEEEETFFQKVKDSVFSQGCHLDEHSEERSPPSEIPHMRSG